MAKTYKHVKRTFEKIRCQKSFVVKLYMPEAEATLHQYQSQK